MRDRLALAAILFAAVGLLFLPQWLSGGGLAPHEIRAPAKKKPKKKKRKKKPAPVVTKVAVDAGDRDPP